MHRVQTTSTANTAKPGSVNSMSTNVEKPVKRTKTTPFQDRNEPKSQTADKNSNNESETSPVETKNIHKNSLFVEILPNFGTENRKPQSTSLNTKVLASCDYYDDTLVASVENAGNIDKLTKHSSLLDDIQSPQIDLSPTLLSPTAAFLLSFPVVSSTLAKSVEPVSYVGSLPKVKPR